MESDANNTSAAANATMQDISEETSDSLQVVSIKVQTKPPN